MPSHVEALEAVGAHFEALVAPLKHPELMRSCAYREPSPLAVLLYSSGWPVLTDFGLVAWLDEPHATSATSMVGTPEFMAPEVKLPHDETAARTAAYRPRAAHVTHT